MKAKDKGVNVQTFAKYTHMQVAYAGRDWFNVHTSDLNRPAIQFAGYFQYFSADRVQIVGNQEMACLRTLRPEEVDGRMDEFFSYKVPCIVICNGDPVPEMLMRKAKENGVPIFCCEESTSKTSHIVVDFLDNVLAPEEAIHANLLDVYNVGVMIRGESGMGKSELSLELIKRGHLLVADDMTVIRKVNSKRLVGYAPETTRNLIEIRGLGIMDVKQLYGMATVLERKSIDIVIDMEMWETGKMYDRLGFDRHYDTIMGVSVPHYVMPVRPGRNLAVVVEATAMDYRVKSAGFNIEEEINRRLERP